MPAINLKFKGNKTFAAFSNLGDTESLTRTWKVCSKVASYLEQGNRLENLSWRLWHLQNVIVDDNARSKREFKKLSKCMSDKLDKEKGRSIEELEAPDFKHNHSTDMIRQRAVEKERNREASQNAKPGTIKRTQFTFSLDQPNVPATANAPVKKPDFKPSTEFRRAKRAAQEEEAEIADDEGYDPHHSARRKAEPASAATLRFPSLFSDNFGPSAMLFPAPTLTPNMTYGEGVGSNTSNAGFSIVRPTIVVPLDELLDDVNDDDNDMWSDASPPPAVPHHHHHHGHTRHHQQEFKPDVVMETVSDSASVSDSHESDMNDDSSDSDYEVDSLMSSTVKMSHFPQQSHQQLINPHTSKLNQDALRRSSTPTMRPHLTVRTTQANKNPVSSTRMQIKSKTSSTRLNAAMTAGPAAAIPRIAAPAPRSAASNNAPGGVKAECVNCGATHTPLWRRGLNDELNCNACGLYSKLHKRPRPKTMRNSNNNNNAATAEARASSSSTANPRAEVPEVIVVAQCYNCHTTTTPLWRKDDEGKTVCNACGLYHKLHGSARPISMKSDVIRKRSRHDARRVNQQSIAETPSASPGASRRPSPSAELSPTLAPDSTTQMSNFSDYDYTSESDYRSSHSQSELMSALGQDNNQHLHYNTQANYSNNLGYNFPGPYHPDYLMQNYVPPDALPFPPENDSQGQNANGRTNKRRRMSVDSASEPPSSAVSYSSYNDGWSSSRSSVSNHSQRPSMEFPFQQYPDYNILRAPANTNTFWHPPMTAQANSPQFSIHPPMLPPDNDSSMSSYLHPPMMLPQEDSYMSQFHPPMMLPQDDDHLFASFTNHDSSSNGGNSNNGHGNNNNNNGGGNNNNNNNHDMYNQRSNNGQNFYNSSY